MNTTTWNLFFLLAAAPMAINGCVDTDSEDESVAYTTGADDGLSGFRPLEPEVSLDVQADCEQAYAALVPGSPCAAAFDELQACLSGLTCEEFVMDPVPSCEIVGEAFFETCRGD